MAATFVRSSRLAPPHGFSHGVIVPAGRLLFVAGQIGWDADGRLTSDEMAGQIDQALANVLEVVRAARGQPADVARVTMYVTDKKLYEKARREIGRVWRARMGRHYPAMTLVEVSALLEPGALVEIEATAVLP